MHDSFTDSDPKATTLGELPKLRCIEHNVEGRDYWEGAAEGMLPMRPIDGIFLYDDAQKVVESKGFCRWASQRKQALYGQGVVSCVYELCSVACYGWQTRTMRPLTFQSSSGFSACFMIYQCWKRNFVLSEIDTPEKRNSFSGFVSSAASHQFRSVGTL